MSHRVIKSLIVVGIVLFLAVGSVSAGERVEPLKPARSGFTFVVKTPLTVVKEVLVIQAKVERTVWTGFLRVGIGVFVRAVQWTQPSASISRPL